MIFNNYIRKLKPQRKIKLYWFRHKYPKQVNFGDELSREIVERVSGRKVKWADKDNCELVAIGSVLQSILQRSGRNHVAVWGTGLMFDDNKGPKYNKENVDFKAVRGKLTAKQLKLNDVGHGDSGLLASLFYKPSKNIKKVGVVPHYVDRDHQLIKKLSHQNDVKIINVYNKPKEVVSEIASCNIVFSSSLHGIITAHSFGVPAYWVELSNNVAGSGFKFRDYYSVFNQKPLSIDCNDLIKNINNADQLINKYQPPNNIDAVKKDLLKTFPNL